MNKEINAELAKVVSHVDMSIVIKRLEQVTIEDTFAKANVRAHIHKYVLNKAEKKLKKKFKICVKQVDKYRKKSYFKSKDQRLIHIMAIDSVDIVVELFVAILMEKGEVPIQNAADKLAKFMEYDDVFDGIKTAAEIITVCAKADLYDLYPNPMTIDPLVRLPKKLRKYIEHTRYLNPMICKPDPWQNNIDGGYISVCQSVLLGKRHHHKGKQSLDALNIVQNIEWELDDFVLGFKEKPNKKLDTSEKRDQFKQLRRISRHVYGELKKQGNSFYFVWRYDFRGRMYSQGHYVNLQSTKYKKALLNFKHREVISDA